MQKYQRQQCGAPMTHERRGGVQGFKSGSPSGVSANPTITALPMSPPPPAPLPGAGAEASAPTMTSGPTAGTLQAGAMTDAYVQAPQVLRR